MKRRLLLEGPVGCGKSTLIRQTPGVASRSAGGFLTERVRDGAGGLAGFVLLPACALSCPDRPCAGRRFLSFENGRTVRDDGTFRTEGVRLLGAAARRPYAVLDEFGGFELLVPEFYAALEEFLSGPVPCVGVWKAPPAAGALSRSLGLQADYSTARARLRRRLEADGDTRILPTAGRGDGAARAALCAWAAQYARRRPEEGGH